MTTKDVLALALDALESIALAGMSGTGQESEEAMTEWHARRAWEFIGTAARAITAIKQAQQAQEPVDEQAAFETWVRNTRGSPWPIALDKSDAGNYMYLPAVEAWQVWQARAALYPTHPASKQAITPETGNAAMPTASAITAGNGQAQESVYWEYRYRESHPQTVNYGEWYSWERLIPRNGLETVENRVAEIQNYIDRGYSYELRALYAHPAPKQAEPAIKESLTVPEGYKLVPPAAFAKWLSLQMPSGTVIENPEWWAIRIYRAMLAAAPTPPAPDVGKPITEPAWQPIETAPFGVQLLVTAEFDGPNDWRIKVGDKDAHGHWIVYGASWKPTHWMPLPTPPEAKA